MQFQLDCTFEDSDSGWRTNSMVKQILTCQYLKIGKWPINPTSYYSNSKKRNKQHKAEIGL